MPYGIDIDIDDADCVDFGHFWEETFFGRVPKGKNAGLPVRAATCKTCGSSKIEWLTWSGKVTSRTYDHEPSYIENARALGEHNLRKTHLRMAKAARLRKKGSLGETPFK